MIQNATAKHSLSGGGNSGWELRKTDNTYIFTVYVAGSGSGCDVIMELPFEQVQKAVQVFYELNSFIKIITNEETDKLYKKIKEMGLETTCL